MSFLSAFKPKPPAPKPPAAPPIAIPAQLPKIAAPKAADIAQSSQPSPAAKALLTPQQTPSQYLNTLQQHKMGDEMVKTLAHGMSDHDGVSYATKSAEKVADKLPPADAQALKAAQAWKQSPTPENQAAAGAAASKANFQGPGAWAAQSAAWAGPANAAPSTAAPAQPRLTPIAVTSAVLMSAAVKANPAVAAPPPPPSTPSVPAMPNPNVVQAPAQPPPTVPPEVQEHTFQQQHPFIALGIDIAAGKA